MKKKVIALMVICSMIAGCAEMVPEPPGEENDGDRARSSRSH